MTNKHFSNANQQFGNLGKNIEEFLRIYWQGIKKLNLKTVDPYLALWAWVCLGITLVYKFPIHQWAIKFTIGGTTWGDFLSWLFENLPRGLQIVGFSLLPIVLVPLFHAFKHLLRVSPYQKKLDVLGMKNAEGKNARVLEVWKIDDNKTDILVHCPGIGKKRFEEKLDDAKTAFGEIVNSVRGHSNLENVVLSLTKKELPSMFKYAEMKSLLKKPYHFLIGQSIKGPLVQNILDLPHMIIAGTSGGGKSNYFNNVLMGLMHSSENIEFRLLDLKLGVETQQFANFPNVQIAQNEIEAVEALEEVNEEMLKRMAFMKEKKIRKIDPHVYKKPIIVVAIDEASVLFQIEKSNKEKKALIEKARDLTQNLAKLSRACGIHLIIATQKVTKETVDTKVQDNTQGRMCFKMSTISSSNTVLGNKLAYELPDTKGRAIWSKGNDFIEVQTPFVSEEDFNDECAALEDKFKSLYGKKVSSVNEPAIESKDDKESGPVAHFRQEANR